MSDVLQRSGGPAVPTTTLVQCDQITIVGDGSHERPLQAIGGGQVAVVTDGSTILGNGTVDDPLHAGSVDGTFRAAFRGGSVSPLPGMPVFFGVVSVPGGITTVQPASATNDPFGSDVAGVVSLLHGDGTVQVQSAGIMVLTTAQWDAVTGDSGGLVLGNLYYLGVFPLAGRLRSTASIVPAVLVTRVGIGISATTMLLDLPALPARNLGDLTFIATLSGQPPLLGSAMRVSANGQVATASSDVSLTNAQVIGVVAAFDVVNGTNPVIQTAGVVTLTTAQWDAVTDTSPGMVAGTAYYVDVNARAGQLTSAKPVIGAVTQVGVGLSTTQMILSAPFPLRLS